MKLACRTRKNSSPQGKPRVYYTGHPEDLALYRDDILSDILEAFDCAVFYDEEPDKPLAKEDQVLLARMQLFVFPITGRFLRQKNRALEEELPLVRKLSVPLLPLMQEYGLEDDFNKKCGKLHFLSKATFSPARYQEKLKEFLSSTLVGNELAEAIRGVFRACIFLSYRKKDQFKVQALMDLLHKDPLFWDTAIWYDEFLIPGENFEEAIQNAIDDCRLFVLSVTPNIVEPNNYVITHEYPAAVNAGKPILPVEMEPTAPEPLEKYFPQLPACIGKRDEAALAHALMDKFPPPTRSSSPERRFLMGLAYLNGVSVEVNRERGTFLISQAADRGLTKATKKLIQTYQGKENTPPCPLAVAWWQKKLVEQLGDRLADSGPQPGLRSYLKQLDHLAEMRREYSLEELETVRPAYRKALEHLERLQAGDGSLQDRRLLVKGYQSYGAICYEISQRDAEARDDPLFQRLRSLMLEKGRRRFWLRLFVRSDWQEAVDEALAKQTHGVGISDADLCRCQVAIERRGWNSDHLYSLYIKHSLGWSSQSLIWDPVRLPEREAELDLFTVNWYLYLKHAYGLTRYINAPGAVAQRERVQESFLWGVDFFHRQNFPAAREYLMQAWQLEEQLYFKTRGEPDLKLLWDIYDLLSPLLAQEQPQPRLRQAGSEAFACYEKARELQARIALETGAENDREALFLRHGHEEPTYAQWWSKQLDSPAEQPLPI